MLGALASKFADLLALNSKSLPNQKSKKELRHTSIMSSNCLGFSIIAIILSILYTCELWQRARLGRGPGLGQPGWCWGAGADGETFFDGTNNNDSMPQLRHALYSRGIHVLGGVSCGRYVCWKKIIISFIDLFFIKTS